MKVFCIGFNKTGTSSLHKFFLSANISSSHDVAWQKLSRKLEFKFLKQYLDQKDAWSDGELADFKNLIELYPDAYFILNTRSLKTWLLSRVKHVFRKYGASVVHQDSNFRFIAILKNKLFLILKILGDMALEYLKDPEAAISDWIDRRNFYHQSAIEFFSKNSQKNFLIINVSEDAKWQEKLSAFLNVKYSSNEKKEIHVKKSTAKVDKLNQHLPLVEKVLKRKCIPESEWNSETYIKF